MACLAEVGAGDGLMLIVSAVLCEYLSRSVDAYSFVSLVRMFE